MCEYENSSSWNTSQALYFDFWQKQSGLAIPEANSYGIKIEERLRCSLRFWIIVPFPSRFLFRRCLIVTCGKLRQIQLATLFEHSSQEPDELCLLWNLMRSLVSPTWFQWRANNFVHTSFVLFCLRCITSLPPLTSPIPLARGPVRETIAHLIYVFSLLCYPLSWTRVPRKIFGHTAWIWGCIAPMTP